MSDPDSRTAGGIHLTNPLLTVVVPVHNGMPFLGAAMESILTQSFADIRIIVIDDGSTDSSGAYLDTLTDSRLTILHQPCAGLGAVLNLGIELCDTPFLARMDADDISLPDRFRQQMSRMLADPELVAIGSPLNFLICDKIQNGLPYPTDHDTIVNDLLNSRPSLCHPTLIMRTSAARATKYRIPGAGEDVDFCLRLAEQGRVSNLESPQYLYRLHYSSISMTRSADLDRGYSYARHTAGERRQGLAETPFPVFAQAWERRSILTRVRGRLKSASSTRYRRARLSWAQGMYVRSSIHLGISLLLQPLKSLRLVRRKLASIPFVRSYPDAAHGS
jgi:glycosyltransferase involved in cell wall biosynthesis